jgi:hypothetical protein
MVGMKVPLYDKITANGRFSIEWKMKNGKTSSEVGVIQLAILTN